MPVRVFLSHASADSAFVETVRLSLEDGRDIECWFDEDKIAPGDDIVVQINGGLANCDLVVVFLSKTSVRSRWVEQELGAAFWDQINSGETRLIPVLIDDCVLPPLLKTKKYVDLRTDQLVGMRKLKSAILRAGPQTPAPAMSYASLPNFVGRERELAELKERLSHKRSSQVEPGDFTSVLRNRLRTLYAQ